VESKKITELEGRKLTPTSKLVIAQRHQISAWIPGAVWALISRPPKLFTLTEYKMLGWHNIHILEQVRSCIQQHRLCVAFQSPSVVHEELECVDKESCSEAWEMAWWGGFVKHYLHPDLPATPEEALTGLLSADIPGMNQKCHKNTVVFVESKGVFKRETQYVSSAIAELIS
jgi:hypothetical protein